MQDFKGDIMQNLLNFLLTCSISINSLGIYRDVSFIDDTIEKVEYKIEQDRLKELEVQRIRFEEEMELTRKLNVGFDPYDLTVPSNITYEELYNVLEGTGLEDIATSLVDSECYNVNSFILCSIVALESSWGKSQKALNYNNLGGVGVYNDNTVGAIYSSRSECIFSMAEFLSRDYLSADGVYFNGYSIWDVNIKYCASSNWADKVLVIANQLLSKYKEIYLK